MSTFGRVSLFDCNRIAEVSDSIDEFPIAIRAIAEQHRPSRMPFFRNLAALDHAVASDPAFLGQIHLHYQSAMHATRAAVYYLPHLDSPSLRKRKLQILLDDDGLPGRRYSPLSTDPSFPQHRRQVLARRRGVWRSCKIE